MLDSPVYTGCMITLCSALSQASGSGPDNKRGEGLLPEEVGVLVRITVSGKSPTEAPVMMAGDKCKEVLGFWLLPNLPDCFGASERFVFKVKKFPNGTKA